MPPRQETQEEIERLERQIENLRHDESAFDRITDHRFSADAVRAHVTQLVMVAFVIFIAALGIFIGANGDQGRANSLLDIMKTLYFPIVTLTLGYYFSSSRNG